MMKLMNTAVAQVRCDGYFFVQYGNIIAQEEKPGMVAMVDSGGGPILCSNPAAKEFVDEKLDSNADAAFNMGGALWLQEVDSGFLLTGADGKGALTAGIPAGNYTQI